MADRNLHDLCPELQELYSQWLEKCSAVGLNVKTIVTWRSAEDQNEAKDCGLSNATAGKSPHNCVDTNGNPASKAFDFGVFRADGSYVTDGTDARYAEAGAIGKTIGLEYGGDWNLEADHCKPDWDHLQLASWRK